MSLLRWALVGAICLLLLAALLNRQSPLPGKGWEVAVVVEGRLYPTTICRDPEVDREHMRITCYRRRLETWP